MHRPLRRALAGATVAAATAPLVVVLAAPAHAAAPSLSIADLKVTETNAVQTKTVTVKLSARSASTVTVKVASANLTATAPADYTAVPLTTLSFAPGVTSKTVSVKVGGDTLDEYDEKFKLVLTSPLRATIARATGTVTVVDDDAAPALTVTGTTLAEGSAGLAGKAVNVSLNAVSGKPVTVAWETAGGTAASGVDFEPAAGTVTVPAGATTKPVPLSIDGDTDDEQDERFYVRLTGVTNAVASATYHRVVIADDDAPRTPVLDRLVPDTGMSRYVTLTGAAESDATIRIYDQGFCDGDPIYTASGSRLGSGGVTVQARDNVITFFTARAVSPRGEVSGCSSVASYWHDSVAPAAPYVWAPASANDNAPRLKGSAEHGATLLLYYGTSCAGDVAATGSATDLIVHGIPVPVGDDTTTWFSARARDAAGNVSACGASDNAYVEDSIAPVVSGVTFPSSGVSFAKVSGTVEIGATVTAVAASADAEHTCGAALAPAAPLWQFEAGMTVPMTLKHTNWVRLLATDAAGNTTACEAAPAYSFAELTTEIEPDNDTRGTADYGPSFPGIAVEQYGSVGAVGDVDHYRVNVNETGTQFVAETFAPPNASITCASNKLDTKLVLYDAAGAIVVQDDDGGEAYCSRLVRNNLAAGVYYLAVTNTAFGTSSLPFPMPYRVAMNYTPPTTYTESEPNDVPGQSTQLGAFSGYGMDGAGAVSTSVDTDYYVFTLNAMRTTVVEVFDTGNGLCAAEQLDSRITLYHPGGSLVTSPDDDGGAGLCSKITVTNLPAGQYYVAVQRSPSASPEHTFGYRIGVR